MPRLQSAGGSQFTRSPIANAQRCLNLYPEINAKDAPVPLTYYQRPGLLQVCAGPPGEVRGFYEASNGECFCCIGNTVYSMDLSVQAITLTAIGQVATATGPITFQDNRTTMLVADGSPNGGWQYDLVGANGWQVFNDPSGLYTGTSKFRYVDTYIIWYSGNTFSATLSNEVTIDPTYTATTTGQPDNLVTIEVSHRYILLLTTKNCEIWFDAGNPGFPFAEVTGLYVPHGCLATASVAVMDLSAYWLSRNAQGQAMVVKLTNFQATKISDHALDWALAQADLLGQGLLDARGYCYTHLGHLFYYLTFPSANMTWVWDEASQKWHQEGYTDPVSGGTGASLAHSIGFVHGRLLAGGASNGMIYQLDHGTYTDSGMNIQYVKGFPHITEIMGPRGTMVACEGKRVLLTRVQADIDTGTALAPGATFSLRYSSDRGNTWGQEVLQPAGDPGAYTTRPLWQTIGMAQDFVFEISWAFAGPVALNGIWYQGVVGDEPGDRPPPPIMTTGPAPAGA